MNEWKGERLETFIFNEATLEHLHRYAIAKDLIKNKIVLDIACGEGYGTNLLAEDAKSVVGVDIDLQTVEKASRKYKRANVRFLQGEVEQIPLPEDSFEVVVSFETLEHTHNQEKMLTEIKRVLKSDGLLIISTPDKRHYSESLDYKNPFHSKELYKEEFLELVGRFFRYTQVLNQKLVLCSIALAGQRSEMNIYEGDYEKITLKKNIDPSYIIIMASDKELIPHCSSIFTSEATLQKALNEKVKGFKNSLSYRIGHFFLFPLKLIRNLFKK